MNNFRDLKVWQEAHKLNLMIYDVTKKFPKEEMFGLTNQTRRSSVSISANIVEGNGRFYFKESLRFLYIARGSLYETEGHLILAKDIRYITEEEYQRIQDQIELVAKLTNGLIRSVKTNKIIIKETVNSEQIAVN